MNGFVTQVITIMIVASYSKSLVTSKLAGCSAIIGGWLGLLGGWMWLPDG